MHDAYEAFQLLKLTVQIESIAAHEDNLLVGTRQGHLLTYSVTQRSIDQKHEVQLLQYCKTFSKKPIQQLEVIPEYQLLVCLTDNVVSVHDLNTINFNLIQTISKTKGAGLFTINLKKEESLTGDTTNIVYMCVSVKRKLQLYFWKNKQQFEEESGGVKVNETPVQKFLELSGDITLNDIPRALTYCDEAICVGFRGEYALYELNGKEKELFPTSSSRSSEPCITKISDTTFALGRECQTVLVNTKGDAETNKVLKWNTQPTVMAWDDPYAIGLLADSVDIHTLEPCGFVQSLTSLPKARLIVRCKQGVLYAASVSHVWCIRAVDIAKQRQGLLTLKQFQLALKLTSISDETEEDKNQKIHQIQTLYAHDLFANKKFSESMTEFLKLRTDPYDVIRLFPDLLPQTAETEAASSSISKLEDKDLENGILALIYYLTAARLKIHGPDNASSSASKPVAQLLQIIDTTLLKCYLQTNDALVAPLLRLNNINLSEAEKTLKKYQKYNELIILYQTKSQHKKALQLLQKQADEPDSCLKGHERTVQYLQNLGSEHLQLIFNYAGWVLDSHPEDGLKIFTEDLEKVEHLPRPAVLDFLLRTHKDLVIPYLEHVIHVWFDTNAIFHNGLIHEYREKVEHLLLRENASSTENKSGQHIRTKLLKFLEQSTHYTAESVITKFPYNSLYEERAIILGRMKKHKEALAIYVLVLHDIEQAIEYCKKIPEPQRQGNSKDDVYVALISMLLAPSTEILVQAGVGVEGVISEETLQPDMETALTLLDKFADKIPPAKALEILPDDVPFVKLRHFLETSLRTQISQRRQSQLLKGLLYAEYLKAQEMRMVYQKQHIIINEMDVCNVCKKRFSNQSAFVRYPDGNIVHYSCQDRKGS